MKISATDAALKAVYSAEADGCRRKSRQWFLWSQIFMLLAASPLLLAMAGAVASFLSGGEHSFALAGFSFFAGVLATFVTMVLFVPFAFYCFYRFYKARTAIEALVGDAVERAGPGPSRT